MFKTSNHLACKPKDTLGKGVEEGVVTRRENEITQRLLRERKLVLLIKGKNPGVQEDFTQETTTQGVGSHEFDMELRESTTATRCIVLNLHGVYSTNYS